MCSYEKAGWLGSRDLRFSNRDLVECFKNFWPYEHFSPVTGMKAGWILAAWTASSHCLLYFPHNKNFISLHWYSYKSCQSYERRECSLIFVFREVCVVSRNWRHNSSPGSLALLNSFRKPGWKFSYEPKAKMVPAWTEPCSPFCLAHVKRPSILYKKINCMMWKIFYEIFFYMRLAGFSVSEILFNMGLPGFSVSEIFFNMKLSGFSISSAWVSPFSTSRLQAVEK